jgi:hypothetical protein
MLSLSEATTCNRFIAKRKWRMNPYQMRVVCSVCGEDAMAWCGRGHPYIDTFVHRDPLVCADNLKAKRRKKEREEKQEQKRLDAFFGIVA